MEGYGSIRRAAWPFSVSAVGIPGRRRTSLARCGTCSQHADLLYADVDLHAVGEPDAAVLCLNEHGFFLAGLVPHGPDGHDHLRLQRPNCENVELKAIVEHPFSKLVRDGEAHVGRLGRLVMPAKGPGRRPTGCGILRRG